MYKFGRIFLYLNSNIFPTISDFIGIYLTLPVSEASTERS